MSSSFSRSVLTVQLGQCGNQIGPEFFKQLALSVQSAQGGGEKEREKEKGPGRAEMKECIDDFCSATLERYFRLSSLRPRSSSSSLSPSPSPSPSPGPSLVPRALLIDMEPKVVSSAFSTASSSGLFEYNPSCSFSSASGSGNNWAYGYNVHAPRCASSILSLIRKEVEHMDMLDGVLLFQSLGGGTGSGVGTAVTEMIRDEYGPSVPLINHCVWPYQQGEVLVQGYNTLLSLSHLNEVSDGIILVQNDHIHTICTRLLGLPRPSFSEINQIIAQNMANILLPAFQSSASSSPCSSPSSSSFASFSSLCDHLFSHPSYHLSSITSIPQVSLRSKSFTSPSWPYLIKHGRQMQMANSGLEEGIDWKVKLNAVQSKRMNEEEGRGREGKGGAGGEAEGEWPSPNEEFMWKVQRGIGGTEEAQESKGAHLAKREGHGEGKQAVRGPSDRGLIRTQRPSSARGPGRASSSSSPSPSPSSLFSSSSPSVCKSLASIVFLRGSDSSVPSLSPFLHPSLYSSFSLSPPLAVCRHPLQLHGDERIISCWNNGAGIVRVLDHMLSSSFQLFTRQAYVHHYERYGVERETFQQHFLNAEQILKNYQSL